VITICRTIIRQVCCGCRIYCGKCCR